MTNIRTLIIDLETRPALAYVWGLFDQNISLAQIKEPPSILSWAATWADGDYIMYDSVQRNSYAGMLRTIYDLLDEADEVVGWNSNRFDIKWLNGEFALQGWGPPSPFRKIDLYQTVKSNFNFLSNKLDFSLGAFGMEQKVKHDGFDLWVGCMNGDREAWAKMEEYNIGDVERTAEMYYKLRPWFKGAVNRSALTGECVCRVCQSTRVQQRGYTYTPARTYKKFVCKDCGAWSRSVIAEPSVRKNVLTGVA